MCVRVCVMSVRGQRARGRTAEEGENERSPEGGGDGGTIITFCVRGYAGNQMSGRACIRNYLLLSRNSSGLAFSMI